MMFHLSKFTFVFDFTGRSTSSRFPPMFNSALGPSEGKRWRLSSINPPVKWLSLDFSGFALRR